MIVRMISTGPLCVTSTSSGLQLRHADHHAFAGRPYGSLRHFSDAPQLPTGYSGMILLALVPPLFMQVMHPHIESESKRLAA